MSVVAGSPRPPPSPNAALQPRRLDRPAASPILSRMIRILIVTDSAVLPSGMAETTRLIFANLLRRYPGQYDLHQIGLFHCYAVTKPDWPIHATRVITRPDGEVWFDPSDKYAEITFPECAARLRPNIVFGYGDPQRLYHLCTPPLERAYRLILYTNVDGLPLPRSVAKALLHADLIVTKSDFSRQVLVAALPALPPEKVLFLYSPADTDRFRPLPSPERAALRRDLLPEWMPESAFVLGWIGRNQWRKQIWIMYKVLHYLRTGAYLLCDVCGKVTVMDWDPSHHQHVEGNGLV